MFCWRGAQWFCMHVHPGFLFLFFKAKQPEALPWIPDVESRNVLNDDKLQGTELGCRGTTQMLPLMSEQRHQCEKSHRRFAEGMKVMFTCSVFYKSETSETVKRLSEETLTSYFIFFPLCFIDLLGFGKFSYCVAFNISSVHMFISAWQCIKGRCTSLRLIHCYK